MASYALSRQILGCSRTGPLAEAIDFVPPPKTRAKAGAAFPQTVLRVPLSHDLKALNKPTSKLVVKAFFGDSPPVLLRLGEQGEAFNGVGKRALEQDGLSEPDNGYVYFAFEEGVRLLGKPGNCVPLRYNVTFTSEGEANAKLKENEYWGIAACYTPGAELDDWPNFGRSAGWFTWSCRIAIAERSVEMSV
jgi:hypothetical protein